MTREGIYQVWRPPFFVWSPWVKPVLFSFLTSTYLESKEKIIPDWRVPLSPDTMLVVDLPGSTAVECGIALARNGYRPVPVYNACPLSGSDEYETFVQSPPVIDLRPILYSLCGTARELEQCPIEQNAPPAFLLDAHRFAEGITPEPGDFDNRSYISQDDFPSPQYVREQGIRNVVIVQAGRVMNLDLSRVIRQFQESGAKILLTEPWVEWQPESLEIGKPTILDGVKLLLKRLTARRDMNSGGFGGVVRSSG